MVLPCFQIEHPLETQKLLFVKTRCKKKWWRRRDDCLARCNVYGTLYFGQDKIVEIDRHDQHTPDMFLISKKKKERLNEEFINLLQMHIYWFPNYLLYTGNSEVHCRSVDFNIIINEIIRRLSDRRQMINGIDNSIDNIIFQSVLHSAGKGRYY